MNRDNILLDVELTAGGKGVRMILKHIKTTDGLTTEFIYSLSLGQATLRFYLRKG